MKDRMNKHLCKMLFIVLTLFEKINAVNHLGEWDHGIRMGNFYKYIYMFLLLMHLYIYLKNKNKINKTGMCINSVLSIYLSYLSVCLVVCGWSVKQQHHHQSELQITPWRGRHGMESLHKMHSARTYLVVVWAADKALQAIWLSV